MFWNLQTFSRLEILPFHTSTFPMPADFKSHFSECSLASHLCRKPFYINFNRGHPLQWNIYNLNIEILHLTGRQWSDKQELKARALETYWAKELTY